MRILCWLVDNIVFLVTKSHTFGLQDNEYKGTKLHLLILHFLNQSVQTFPRCQVHK